MATKQIGNNGSSTSESSFDNNSGSKYILGIGIDAYTDFQRLNNAVRDVEDVIKVLKTRYQFENATVNLLTNAMATREHILTQLENYEDLGPEDILIIYYSGHGHLKQGKHGYWIPYDAKKNVAASYISTSDVLTRIRSINAKHILLISDSCFSGAFLSEDAIKRGAAGEMALNDLAGLRSRWGICSGRQDEYVYDGEPGKNSPFAESIIRLLTDNRQHKFNISWLVNEVMKLTRDKSKHLPEGKPLLDTGDKGGQLILQLREDIKQWHALEEKPNKSSKDYADFLEKYKTSIYTVNALEAKRAHYDTETWQNAERMNTMSGYENYLQSDHTPKAYEQEALNQKRNLVNADQQAWEKAIRNMRTSLQEYTKRSDEGKHLDLAKKWVVALEDKTDPTPLPSQKPSGEMPETPKRGGDIPTEARPKAVPMKWDKKKNVLIAGVLALFLGIWATCHFWPKPEEIVSSQEEKTNEQSEASQNAATASPADPQPNKSTAPAPNKNNGTSQVKPREEAKPEEFILTPDKLSGNPSERRYSYQITSTETEVVILLYNLTLKKLLVETLGQTTEQVVVEQNKPATIKFPKVSASSNPAKILIVLSELGANNQAKQLETLTLAKNKKAN